MSRRSHGATYSGARSATFSQRAWEKMQAAQARFAAEAFALGQDDAAHDHPQRINMSAAYYAGYQAPERVA